MTPDTRLRLIPADPEPDPTPAPPADSCPSPVPGLSNGHTGHPGRFGVVWEGVDYHAWYEGHRVPGGPWPTLADAEAAALDHAAWVASIRASRAGDAHHAPVLSAGPDALGYHYGVVPGFAGQVNAKRNGLIWHAWYAGEPVPGGPWIALADAETAAVAHVRRIGRVL